MAATAGGLILASDVSSIADRVTVLEAGPDGTRDGCTLRRAANQSVNTGTTTSISWDTEDADPQAFISVTSATITIPSGLGGLYGIVFNVAGNVDVAARFLAICAITSALTGYPSELRAPPSNGTEDLISASWGPIPLLAGDSFLLRTFHSSVGAVNMTAWMTCYRVGV